MVYGLYYLNECLSTCCATQISTILCLANYRLFCLQDLHSPGFYHILRDFIHKSLFLLHFRKNRKNATIFSRTFVFQLVTSRRIYFLLKHKIFCFKFEISFKISSRFDWLTAWVTGVCKIATNHTDRNHSSTQQGKSRGQQWWFWQEGLSWSSLLIFCSENWAGLEEDTVQGGARIIFLAGKCASNPLKKIIFIIIA